MSDSWASTDLGPEKAFMARTLAHPEVSFTASHKLMTFEEYSILYSLSPAEPLGSRIDEYATQYLQAGIDLLFSGTTRSHITRLQADVNRMALLINAPVLSDWEPNHTELINKTSQWVGPVVGPTITYKEWLFFELIAHVWLPYTAAPPPSFTAEDGSTVSTYGPCLNHRDLRFDERFATPGQWPAPLYPRPSWQPDPNMEPPLLRPATEVDILEPCPICRYIPIELGETISVLPCEGGLDKHIFHPHCIGDWHNHKRKQCCAYGCVQRPRTGFRDPVLLGGVDAIWRPIPEEWKNFDLSFTFQNSPNVGWDYDDGEEEEEEQEEEN